MSDTNSESGNPQRWWEGYLVRYFLGFIVGIICIATLGLQTTLTHANLISSKLLVQSGNQLFKLPEFSFAPIATILALLGFSYCYIASSPITVLHSTRMMRTWFHRNSRSFWMAWSLTLLSHLLIPAIFKDHTDPAIPFLILFGALLLLCLSSTIFSRFPAISGHFNGAPLAYNILFAFLLISSGLALINSYTSVNTSLLAFTLPVLWLLLGQYWVLFALLVDDNKKFVEFYKNISIARQKKGSRDIRDSYTHLREHANSVFVVLIELCILAGLLVLRQVQAKFIQTSDPIIFEINYWNAVLIIVGIWLVPTVFMWSLANRLERTFADNSDDFLDATP